MIIGLSGKMGSGKSTLANHIISTSNKAVTVKIAGILYDIQDMIYTKLNMTLEGEKDRPLLIAVGMWGRDKDQDFWCKKALDQAQILSSQSNIVIIDDIRFPNEALAVQNAGGLLIRIEGTQRGPNLTPEALTSTTETALDEFDFEYTINNQVSQEQVFEQYTFISEQFKHRR